ncbi:MAG TPA: carbohydrate porin [Candidatus Binatus sp.]|nr:carbohydrate porin [Candidatus Binatus sp.]
MKLETQVVRFRFRNVGKNLLLTFFLAPALVVSTTHAAEPEPAASAQESSQPIGISANPGAVDQVTGTGLAGEWLGFTKDSGVFLGGVWTGNTNYLISGGEQPRSWSWNSLLILNLDLDSEKLIGWKGGKFGIDFLRFDGEPTNERAGSVQGYNALPGPPPLHRSELYEVWWRQELFDRKLIVRIGKTVPTVDFNNVLRPVPTQDQSLFIPSVSGLLFTPVFKNATLIGAMPGYYNSAFGVTTTFAPTNNFYLSYGVYDGNLATGSQTGTKGPQFNGYYFHIGEAGAAWEIGSDNLPGSFGIGLWNQTGQLRAHNVTESGAMGFYIFGSQRIWFRHPGEDNSGISGFFQFGANDSETLPMNEYFGSGLTAFGLVPGRSQDSAGAGMAWSWLNGNIFHRSSELMFQAYYQAHLIGGMYFEPAITYIPTPGANPDLDAAWATTVQVTILF